MNQKPSLHRRLALRVSASLGVAMAMVPLGGLLNGRALAASFAPSTTRCAPVAGVTTTSFFVAAVDGPNNDHSVMLDTDLYIPHQATAATPQPAIIFFHGAFDAKDGSAGCTVARLLSSRGYVVLAYSAQGNGRSGGVLEFDSPDYDVKDAEQMIDILGKRPEVLKDRPCSSAPRSCDPRVGLVGGSYGGAIQELLAEFDPRVDVVTPWRTWNTGEYSTAPNNLGLGFDPQAQPLGILKQGWNSLIYADATVISPAQRQSTEGAPLCPGADLQYCQAYRTTTAEGRPDAASKAYADAAAPATYIDNLRVPTMLVQGESDTLFNLNEAVATYNALKARHVPVEMIWQSGGHGYDTPQTGAGSGEGDLEGQDFSNPMSKYLPPRLISWLDHYLRDPSVPTGPEFAYFRDWIKYDRTQSAAPAYGTSSGYPAAGPDVFALSGTDQLVPAGQAPSAATVTLVNPPGGTPASYTETPNFSAPDASPGSFAGLQPSDPPGESVSFTSPVFDHDVVVVGVPSLHLRVASAAGQDVVLFARLFDVAPDGSATLIHREVSPVRVVDTSRAFDMHLLGVAHQFAAGHRVRLGLASTDQGYADNRVADVISLATGGTDAATFSLPVVLSTTETPPMPVAPASAGLPNTAGGGGEALGLWLLAACWLAACSPGYRVGIPTRRRYPRGDRKPRMRPGRLPRSPRW